MAGSSHRHQRHLVEGAHRSALAGSAGAVWSVADLCGSALSLATRRALDRLLTYVQTKSDAMGEVVWEVSVDSSTARAHQHASGARRRRSRADEKRGSRTSPTKDSGAAVEG
jgi:hypothetical protein